jgi:hypothetical protein
MDDVEEFLSGGSLEALVGYCCESEPLKAGEFMGGREHQLIFFRTSFTASTEL